VKSKNQTYNIQLNTKNGLFFTKDNIWRTVLAFKTVQAIDKINPLAFFCFKNEPLILFFHNPFDLPKIHQLCWNFNKAPVIVILKSERPPISSEYNELLIYLDDDIEIYNGFDLDEKEGLLRPLDIKIEEFNYWNIVSGRIWEQYASVFKNENKVDYKLLNNIEAARTKLIGSLKTTKASLIINRILGRLIFVRYLIDREVKINFKQEPYLSKDDLIQIISNQVELYELFVHLQTIFNGDLFPFVGETKEQVQNGKFEKEQLTQSDLELISTLFRGDNIISGQTSLFHIYDFSIIPIELVSNIYEYFMGKEKQTKNKAFYTPPFLVDYLINETIDPFLKTQNTWHCTTLDPACGSGVFLVETLRRIIIKFKSLNPNLEERDITKYKSELLNLLETNIFGIDKDRDAIDVAIFSLYVTILDFIAQPKDIEGFRFRSLIGKNFLVGDFFPFEIEEINEGKKVKRIIDFSENFDGVQLNFIIGNPPWGRVKKEYSPFLEYSTKRLKNEPRELERLKALFPINKQGKKRQIKLVENNEIAQAFLLRTSDFAKKNLTKCALLVTSKVLHNGRSDVFRNYLFNNARVEKVVDFSAISEHLFKQKKSGSSTLGPAAFLVYSWEDLVEDNFIFHYSPKLNLFFNAFNVLVIESFDNKKIKQSTFLKNDWAWKVFLYGSKLDFRFISFLKKNYQTIANVTDDEDEFIKKQGVIIGGGDPNDASHFKDFPLIEASNIERYYADISLETEWYLEDKKIVWDRKFAHRAKKELFDIGLFHGETLLIRKGLNSNYHCISAFTKDKGAFRDSITGIKTLKKDNINLLKSFSGLLNSNYFSYFIFNTGSSTGIERKQVHNYEKFSLPIIYTDEIPVLVDKISSLKSQIHEIEENTQHAIMNERVEADLYMKKLEEEALGLEKQIEKAIHDSFNFTNEEKALIDFSQEVSIPLFKGESKPFKKVDDVQLKKYTAVFNNFLKETFQHSDRHFEIKVLESPFMIGVQFKIVPEKPDKIFSYHKDQKQKQILDMLSVISLEEQITDKIFIQKDVKIINKDSFWIVKPNEFKCWHEAVAYLDLEEFIPKLIVQQPQKTEHFK
jgi:hypothetical protein